MTMFDLISGLGLVITACLSMCFWLFVLSRIIADEKVRRVAATFGCMAYVFFLIALIAGFAHAIKIY